MKSRSCLGQPIVLGLAAPPWTHGFTANKSSFTENMDILVYLAPNFVALPTHRLWLYCHYSSLAAGPGFRLLAIHVLEEIFWEKLHLSWQRGNGHRSTMHVPAGETVWLRAASGETWSKPCSLLPAFCFHPTVSPARKTEFPFPPAQAIGELHSACATTLRQYDLQWGQPILSAGKTQDFGLLEKK